LKQSELLTSTDTDFADVAPHVLLLLLLLLEPIFLLNAYAPMYKTLIDPPYECAP
jgi:hypothetical protein